MNNLNEALAIIQGKIENWIETTIGMLPNVIVALLVMALFVIIAKFSKGLSSKLLSKVSDRRSLNEIFGKLIFIIIVLLGLFTTLNILHLEKALSSLLAGAGILGLAMSFAFQDITANFISGVLMAIRRPFTAGDIIKTQGYFGKVEKIDLRVTILRTFQGLNVIIPNKDVFQNPLTNYTKTHDRRIDLKLGVSYNDDLEKVKQVTIDALSKLDFIMPNKEVNVFFEEFADSSINFTVMVWIEYPDEPGYLEARSQLIMTIKKVYDEEGITIPFPIRTLDFGENSKLTINKSDQ